jgi:hypothetical protein
VGVRLYSRRQADGRCLLWAQQGFFLRIPLMQPWFCTTFPLGVSHTYAGTDIHSDQVDTSVSSDRARPSHAGILATSMSFTPGRQAGALHAQRFSLSRMEGKRWPLRRGLNTIMSARGSDRAALTPPVRVWLGCFSTSAPSALSSSRRGSSSNLTQGWLFRGIFRRGGMMHAHG